MFKFLHTSDWHLGATLHEIDRHPEHQAFLDWLLETLAAEQADALVVAGDVFDSANPPAEALRLLCAFLGAAARRLPKLQIVLTGGNHDSALRLEAPRELFALASTRVVGAWPWAGDGWDRQRLCIPLADRDGRTAAWLGAVPFMRPGDLYRATTASPSAETSTAGLPDQSQISNFKFQIPPPPDSCLLTPGSSISSAVARLYAAAAAALRDCRQDGQALLLTGHLYAAGGQLSPDSERLIQRGNLEVIPAEAFPEDAAYVALGHLHLAQRVARTEHIRYSGSPLPLSFSETRYAHQVLAVTLDGPRFVEARPLPVPRFRDLRRIPEDGPGEKAVVLEALQALAEITADTPEARRRWPLLEARVRLAAPDPQLRRDVEDALKGRAALLARLEAVFARTHSAADSATADAPDLPPEQLEAIGPEQVFLRKWRDDFGADPAEPLRHAFLQVLETVQQGGEQ